MDGFPPPEPGALPSDPVSSIDPPALALNPDASLGDRQGSDDGGSQGPGPLSPGSEAPDSRRVTKRPTPDRRTTAPAPIPMMTPPPESGPTGIVLGTPKPSTATRRPFRATTGSTKPTTVPPRPSRSVSAAPPAAARGNARPAQSGPARIPGGPTLAIDIGGTGLKASVLDQGDKMETARVRVPTTYPMPPARMVSTLAALVAPLPAYERISVGFPGVVRQGKIVTAPHFVTRNGPGTKVDKSLLRAWTGFDLGRALGQALGKPVRMANDADLQGAAVIQGKGLELVVTLGTGVGTGLFWQGHLAPHLELAQHPLARGETYNQRLGEAARKKVGNKAWRKRVLKAIATLETLINYDHLYIGGGNAARMAGHVGDAVTVVDNDAGILGGIKLWEGDVL